MQAGVEVRLPRPFTLNGQRYPLDTAVVTMPQPYGSFAEALLRPRLYPDQRDANGHPIAPYDVTAHALPLLMNVRVKEVFRPLNLVDAVFPETGMNGGCGNGATNALYKSSVPTMDEGWTRWTLDHQRIGNNLKCVFYESVNDQQIRKGELSKFDGLVIPDQSPRTILNGYRNGAMPPEFIGGLGSIGVKAIHDFVENGGTLILLNRASDFAIQNFKLPLRDVVAGLPRTQFYVPGSILRLELDTTHPIAKDMPRESIAWAEDSPAFEVINDPTSSVPAANVKIIGWYPRHKDLLLSGWLLGGERIKGKAALVEVKMGKGKIILFGFRPQYRAQSLATYPLFFNSLR
jgi:hypothetical protein